MGQLIDFAGKDLKKIKPDLTETDIIYLLPKLKILKGETIVIYINESILKDDVLLNRILREIFTIKCMGTSVVIIPDVNFLMKEFCEDNFNIANPFDKEDFFDTLNQVEILDVIFKSEVLDKIILSLKKFNAMALGMSGHNLDIIFPDSIIERDNDNLFVKQTKSIYNGFSEKKNKKYSINTLEELLKTDIIPVIVPTFKIVNGKIFVMESSLFGSYLANYLSALKYVLCYTNDDTIPSSCVYGSDRFTKIFETGKFSLNAKKMIKSGLEAVKNGVQSVNIIDMKYASFLEELCNVTLSGIFLYDDTLNQL